MITFKKYSQRGYQEINLLAIRIVNNGYVIGLELQILGLFIFIGMEKK